MTDVHLKATKRKTAYRITQNSQDNGARTKSIQNMGFKRKVVC